MKAQTLIAKISREGRFKGTESYLSVSFWKFSLLLLLQLTLLIISVAPGFAEDPPATNPNPDAAIDGPAAINGASVGTLVAAVLETVGYQAQADILNNLKEMLTHLGALIYVCCILSAILALASGGKYEIALWLLVGPAMFFFLIQPPPAGQKISAGAEWQFGKFADSQHFRDKLLNSAGVQLDDASKVSWFFHGYNSLVSNVIQQLVKVITNNDVRSQMLFMTREKMIDDLFAKQIEKPDLLNLATIINANCWKEMNAARIVAIGHRDPMFKRSPEYQRAIDDYCKFFDGDIARFSVSPGPAQDALAAELKILRDGGARDNQLINVSCKEAWTTMTGLVQREAGQALGSAKDNNVSPAAPDNIYQKILADVRAKLSSPEKVGEKAPAPEIVCPSGQTPSSEQLDDAGKIQRIFTAWMIKKAMAADNRGPMLAQIADHAGVQLKPYDYHNDQSMDVAFDIQRRFNSDKLAQTTRFETYTVAMTLPYIQGAGLYILATLFPFFALLVIVPGQAGSFFMWCALWLWFKSWDIGWALVMVADELLWSVMPHSSYFKLEGGYMDPITVFEAAFQGDYAYNLATYYVLLSGMITAVPIISANAVLGSKKAIAGIFLDGLKTMATAMTAKLSDQISVEQLRSIDVKRDLSMASVVTQKLAGHSTHFIHQMDQYSEGHVLERSMLELATGPAAGTLDLARGAFSAIESKTGWKIGGVGVERFLQQTPDQMRARLAELNSKQNKYEALVNARVREADGTIGKLGEKRAIEEIARRTQMFSLSQDAVKGGQLEGPLANVSKLAEGLGINIDPNSKPTYEILDEHLLSAYDPNKKTIDGSTPIVRGPSEEHERLRMSIDNARDLADLSKGLGEYMIARGAAGKALSAVVESRLGPRGRALLGSASTYGFLTSESAGVALFEMGLKYDRAASYYTEQYIHSLSKEYYFLHSQNDEWKFYETIRAGVSRRIEWWNVENAPADNRAMAHYMGERLDDYLPKYSMKGLGDLAGSLLPK